jgi:hypothetical protein
MRKLVDKLIKKRRGFVRSPMKILDARDEFTEYNCARYNSGKAFPSSTTGKAGKITMF